LILAFYDMKIHDCVKNNGDFFSL